MSPSANYVTQSSIYDCPMLGRLTNRAINKYKKAGFYASNTTTERAEQRKKKSTPSRQTIARKVMDALLADLT